MDHSAGSVPVKVSTQTGRRKKAADSSADESSVDEAWRLNEVEEAILLEVLVAELRKTRVEAASTVKKVSELLLGRLHFYSHRWWDREKRM